MSDDERDGTTDQPTAVVLDFLPHGRTDDDRPQYQKEPLAYVLDHEEFALHELVLEDDADISIGDQINLEKRASIQQINRIEYDDLPGGASSELEYVIEELVEENEKRFVNFYNEAQPITLRLHQLNLLPGIGKKLRNNILDERKRQPFESFEELESRISGLHNPREILVERIIEELQEQDLKYRLFVREEE